MIRRQFKNLKPHGVMSVINGIDAAIRDALNSADEAAAVLSDQVTGAQMTIAVLNAVVDDPESRRCLIAVQEARIHEAYAVADELRLNIQSHINDHLRAASTRTGPSAGQPEPPTV